MKFANGKSLTAIALFTALTLVPTLSAQTQTLTVLHSFAGLDDLGCPSLYHQKSRQSLSGEEEALWTM